MLNRRNDSAKLAKGQHTTQSIAGGNANFVKDLDKSQTSAETNQKIRLKQKTVRAEPAQQKRQEKRKSQRKKQGKLPWRKR